MNDRAMAGTAGLRSRNNVELMFQRRDKLGDGMFKGMPLNELDAQGRGIQVKANFRMLIHDRGSTNKEFA